MVPKVARAGRSFKGAALYYLHDKKANTADRVAFTETLNLPTDDPSRAVAQMIDTAAHADQLKAANGIKTGRKLEKPVYAYSLAWHPSEAPTQAEQLEAARESLQALGLTDRQALIVSHNDTDHPHVHVIVNRVCPETGKAASISNDRLKLSKWAQDYEKRRGKVFCGAREANNANRLKGDWVKDASPSRQQWREWKKAQTKELWEQYRADKEQAGPIRKAQYEALWRQKEERVAARREEIKALYKPQWRELFRRQRDELRDYDRRLSIRLRHARRMDGNSIINMFRAVVNDRAQREAFIRQQEAERRDLGAKHKQTVRDAAREVTKAWKYDRDQLRQFHREQDSKALDKTRTRVDEVWKANPSEVTPAQQAGQTEREKAERAQGQDKTDSRTDKLSSFFAKGLGAETVKEAQEKAREEERTRRKRNRTRNRDDGGRNRDGP